MVKINLNIFQTCSSTNDIAIDKAKQGLPEGSSYLAYSQSMGRGRNNNKWESMNGNLFLSTIFRPEKEKNYWHQLSLIVGFSIFEVLINLGIDANQVQLKWPNDVLVDNKKISGVLLESFNNFVVVGIGLNISKNPSHEIKWKTTKLSDYLEKELSIKNIANILLKKIFKNYCIWNEKGFIFFKNKINYSFKNVNKRIIIKINSKHHFVDGIFLGLGDNGSLRVKVDNELIEYFSVESFFFPDIELS